MPALDSCRTGLAFAFYFWVFDRFLNVHQRVKKG